MTRMAMGSSHNMSLIIGDSRCLAAKLQESYPGAPFLVLSYAGCTPLLQYFGTFALNFRSPRLGG